MSNPVQQVLSIGATGARFTPDDGPVIEVGAPSAHRTVLAVPDAQGLSLGWLEVWFDVLPSAATQTALSAFVATIGAWSHMESTTRRQGEPVDQLDEPTGLLNRRGFDHQAALALHQAHEDDDVAVVLATLDPRADLHGEEAIVALAHALEAAVRRSDVVARIAEDGCAAFLRDCDRDAATRIVRRARANLSTHIVGGRSLSASFGVSTARASDAELHHLETLAEQAMNEAERAHPNTAHTRTA